MLINSQLLSSIVDRRMKNQVPYLLSAVALSFVSACGGGGEGDVAPVAASGASPPSNPPGSPPPPPPPPVSTSSVGNVSKATSGGLPSGLRNAAERKSFPHYIGSLKDLSGGHPKQLPMRTYFASCDVDTSTPRMFVSMTLEDTSVTAHPTMPTIGSVFETVYDPATKSMRRTGNETVLDLCHETHGITVNADCSRVAVLCNTDFEEPVSERERFTRDLVAESGKSSIDQPNNERQVDNNSNIAQGDKASRYRYNGEVWLLEWDGVSLASQPDSYVIHKAVGGQQLGATTLVYSEDQDVYGAAFTTNTFDSGGGRHKSGALMVVDRDGWLLNPDDPRNNDRERGWTWGCAGGHVLHMRAFFNPFTGYFGALCTSDGAKYWKGANQGAIAAKMETSSTTFEGYESFIVASHNSAITNGGGHKLIPVDPQHSIIAIVGTDIVPEDDPDFLAFIKMTEDAAIARNLPYRGIEACEWWDSENCIKLFLDEYYYDNGRSRFQTFRGGFWGGNVRARELTKIGILRVDPEGDDEIGDDIQYVQWVVEDDDCMLGAPQLTDLQNERYLLGWAKFQCVSDGTKLKRFSGKHTLHPKAYYLMEIDAAGTPLNDPVEVPDTGWGGMDEMVNLGIGRAAWAYIPNPTLDPNGNFSDPYQRDWEFMVYESASD